MIQHTPSVDPEEIERFSRIAEEWWDPRGKFAPLHRLNPARIEWILQQVTGNRCKEKSPPDTLHPAPSLSGITLLDIGCGGGLVAEPMARLGAAVTAIDASEKNINVARLHAGQSGLSIDYRCAAAEELIGTIECDVVLALEIVEHVADVEFFVNTCLKLVRPGGLLIMSTLNRTLKSYAFAIVGAEYVLRWLPRGTHDWKKFLRPSELAATIERAGGRVTSMAGLVMNPLTFAWSVNPRDLEINYLLAARRS